MKIFLITLIAASICFGLTNSANSQASADVSAEVVGTVEVNKIEDVSFGQIVQNSEPDLDPNNPGSSSDVGASAQVGEFVVDSGGENDVILNFSTTVELTGPGDDITFSSNLVGDSDESNQSSALQRSDGEQVTTSPDGFFYLWLGGDLGTIPAAQEFGEYDGTFTITVTFP